MKSMKSMPNLLLATILLTACAAYAGDRVDEERAVEPDGVVQISNLRGDVQITGWDRALVAVEGELDDLATGFTFEVDGDETLIKVEMPKHDVNYGDGSDLRISMPHQSRVKFSGVSTDATVHDVFGGAAIRTVSGDVDIDGVDNEVLVKSVSGDIEMQDAKGHIRVTSVSGELTLELQASDVSVDTVSGDIDLQLNEFDRLSSTSVSGDQDVSGQLKSGGRVTMKSVSGEIELRLVGTVDAEISVNTGPGGDIINDLTRDRPKEIFPARAMLDTTAGAGSGEIRISSVTGDVRLSGD